jgi:hypothetical protein
MEPARKPPTPSRTGYSRPRAACLSVDVGNCAANQRERRKREHICIEDPLNRGKIGAEIGTQPRQRDGQCGTIDERHRGCKHAGGKHHATTVRRCLPSKLSWTWLGCNNAATARLHKRLRHCFSQGGLIDRPFSQASCEPSSACRGADARSVRGDATLPIGFHLETRQALLPIRLCGRKRTFTRAALTFATHHGH